MIDVLIFCVGLLVSILVVYSLFAQVPLEMGRAQQSPALGDTLDEKGS